MHFIFCIKIIFYSKYFYKYISTTQPDFKIQKLKFLRFEFNRLPIQENPGVERFFFFFLYDSEPLEPSQIGFENFLFAAN